MSIHLSDELLSSVGMTDDELLRELALHLFRTERLTLAQASRLSGMARTEFQRLLAERRIPVHYGIEEFRHDLKNLSSAGLL
jgi:predicted HTH domain antitoxin